MAAKKLKAFVLAAGFGTRLRPLTNDKPKALLPFMNQPMLLHVLDQIETTPIKEVCINAHYKWEAFEEALKQYKGPLEVYLSVEKKQILGTGGGLANAKAWRQDSDLLVLNADIIHTFDLNEMIIQHYHSQSEVTLGLTNTPHPGEAKIWCDGQRICSMGEQTNPSQVPHGFACIHLIADSLLRALPKGKSYSIIPIYQKLLAEGKDIKAYISNGHWIDMGTPEKYFGSLFDFATRIKSKETLNHPAFAEEEKSLGEYQKILQQFQDEHPDLFKELEKKKA